MAAEKLHVQAMELLLKAGADPAVKDWRGKTVRACLIAGKQSNRLQAQKCLLLLDKHAAGPEREIAARRLRERGVRENIPPKSLKSSTLCRACALVPVLWLQWMLRTLFHPCSAV